MEKNRLLKFYLSSILFAGLIGGLVTGSSLVLIQRLTGKIYPEEILVKKDGKILENGKQIITTEESAITDVVEKASPAIVSVVSDTFQFNPSTGPQAERAIVGSGFIISPDGSVITNVHVVSDPGAQYFVVTQDKKFHRVEKIGRNVENDVALLKISASNLPYLKLGSTKSLKPGKRVIAIGTALGRLESSVSTGIISALGREITAQSPVGPSQVTLKNIIQIDAALNPGNSGGPLLDLSGEVVGINFAITQGAENIGFAIPSDMAEQAISAFLKGEDLKTI